MTAYYRGVSLRMVVGETFPAFLPLVWMVGQWIIRYCWGFKQDLLKKIHNISLIITTDIYLRHKRVYTC
jgi:hypothetical protein